MCVQQKFLGVIMNKPIEIVETVGSNTRLTITPNRVTLKIAKGVSQNRRNQILAFANYVTAQFVVVVDTWRGVIKFKSEGVELATVSMRSDNAKQPNRRYEGII